MFRDDTVGTLLVNNPFVVLVDDGTFVHHIPIGSEPPTNLFVLECLIQQLSDAVFLFLTFEVAFLTDTKKSLVHIIEGVDQRKQIMEEEALIDVVVGVA